jgi:hypothetical protein
MTPIFNCDWLAPSRGGNETARLDQVMQNRKGVSDAPSHNSNRNPLELLAKNYDNAMRDFTRCRDHRGRRQADEFLSGARIRLRPIAWQARRYLNNHPVFWRWSHGGGRSWRWVVRRSLE